MVDVITNLELQLSELEMLRSMFPEKNAVQMDDPTEEIQAKRLIEKQNSDSDFPRMSYKLSLTVTGEDQFVIEIYVQMNENYPNLEKPEIYVKSESFSRESQSQINKDLNEYLNEMVGEAELIMGVLVGWIQESGMNYRKKVKEESKQSDKSEEKKKKDSKFCRLWIYSHHIYSKIKRKNILDLAPDFDLTGFCMPGKPGIICLEGSVRNCTEAWGIIKSWNWKKINVKIQEEEQVRNQEQEQKFRKFEKFEEIGFVKNSENRDYHMDMGEFFSYLKGHQSEHMFKELFGITKGDS